MKNRLLVVTGLLLLGLSITGCQSHRDAVAANDPPAPVRAMAQVQGSKAAATQPINTNVTGFVKFEQTSTGVNFVAEIDGLAPNTTHGFHIHDKGDLSAPDLSSAGGHFNPTSQPHGGPDAEHHHLGDLGNLTADANGHAHLEGSIANVSLSGIHSILGKSVIIHAKTDDLKSQPSGDSGARVAGGVIELAK